MTRSRTCNVRVNRDTWCSVGLSPAGRGGGSDAPLDVVEVDEAPEAAASDLPPLAMPASACSAGRSSGAGAPWFLLLLGLVTLRRRRELLRLLAVVPVLFLFQCNTPDGDAATTAVEEAAPTNTNRVVHVAEDLGVAAHVELETAITNGDFVDVSISPDGQRVALSHFAYEGLSVINTETAYLQVLTREERSGWSPVWAADGASIATRSQRSFHVPDKAFDFNGGRVAVPPNSQFNVQAVERDESIEISIAGQSTLIGPPGDRYYMPEVSPDENFVSFFGLSTGLYIYRVEDERLFHFGQGTHARFDPEGRWLVFERLGDDGHVVTSGDLYLVDLDHAELAMGRIETGVDRIEHAPSLSRGRIVFLSDGVALMAELVADAQ